MSWVAVLVVLPSSAPAHDHHGHQAPTYEVTAPVQPAEGVKRLLLNITDGETGALTPARFSLVVDGQPFVPPALGEHGLRFVSIHQGKQQRFVVTYARGSGAVEVPLPPEATSGRVSVAKGFEYPPIEIPFELSGETATVEATLRRWADLQRRGWFSADEHLHYERFDPANDRDWLTMLAADDLAFAHFLVLKGGNLPGVWAQQFAFGKLGEGGDGRRLIRPGEEYRDASQGHINLLGINELIPPISTGGTGGREAPYHYPPFVDVFRRARELGGIGGPAHGGTLSRTPTAVLDTLLGAVDFFEIGNTHLYKTDVWYRLMNCGYVTPPAAGTDLPNFPFRDAWQPFLGEIRMHVRVGENRDFESWKQALLRGEVFVTSGPIIELAVNGVGPGGIVRLPAAGEIEVAAELASPLPLKSLELVENGLVVGAEIDRAQADGIHRWRIRRRVLVERSCWLAARGEGDRKRALEAATGIQQNTVAHTAPITVLVGDQPITSPKDADYLLAHLAAQQEYYRTEGRFERPEHRARLLELFDLAIERLMAQSHVDGSR
jgi:hypothetical protein